MRLSGTCKCSPDLENTRSAVSEPVFLSGRLVRLHRADQILERTGLNQPVENGLGVSQLRMHNRVREGPKPHGGRTRSGEVGPRHIIDEPDEQRRAIFGGAWGEKGAGQGEHRSI